MLTELHIKNFAIIEDLTINFSPGFSVMTGETGAGKTIIVEALNLVLGARAQTDMIRAGEDAASVVAVFDLKDVAKGVLNKFKELGVDCSEEIVIKRTLSKEGKNRASLNGEPVSGQLIKEVAAYLVDVSSQHNQQILLDPQNHIYIIDDFGGLEFLRGNYFETYTAFVKQRDKVLDIKAREKDSKEKLEFIKYQIDELKAAALRPGEDEELAAIRSRAKNATKLFDVVSQSETAIMSGHDAVLGRLESVSRLLSKVTDLDKSLKECGDAIESAVVTLDDSARSLKRYLDNLSVDPKELESIEDRLQLIGDLKRKYGGSIENILLKFESLKAELHTIENYDDILKTEEEILNKNKLELSKIASELSKKRKDVAARLAQLIQEELKTLAMGKTTFHVSLTPTDIDSCQPTGIDVVELLISPNMGEPLRPLVRIISGGELSRVMLAIKKVVAQKASLASTYIFDEVDSGIGGAVAEVVGRKLKEIAASHQVICITHLPQVASFANSHYNISKDVKQGRTITSFKLLVADERVDEIARMLGGVKITDTTRIHAREMIDSSS